MIDRIASGVQHTRKFRIECDEARKFAIVEEVKERLSRRGDASIDDTDGVRVSYAGGVVADARVEHAGGGRRARRGKQRGRAGAPENPARR